MKLYVFPVRHAVRHAEMLQRVASKRPAFWPVSWAAEPWFVWGTRYRYRRAERVARTRAAGREIREGMIILNPARGCRAKAKRRRRCQQAGIHPPGECEPMRIPLRLCAFARHPLLPSPDLGLFPCRRGGHCGICGRGYRRGLQFDRSVADSIDDHVALNPDSTGTVL